MKPSHAFFRLGALYGGLLAVLLLAAGQAQANEALARKNDCMGCHAINTKLVGPAYADVAAKYAGQADGAEVLARSIRNGGVGKWGDLPMPPHPKLSDADALKLARWVLGAKPAKP